MEGIHKPLLNDHRDPKYHAVERRLARPEWAGPNHVIVPLGKNSTKIRPLGGRVTASYMMGIGSSAFTRCTAAAAAAAASDLEPLPAPPPVFSFFNFLLPEPCFPPSDVRFCNRTSQASDER